MLYTYMLAHSYLSRADQSTQELLWLQCQALGGWMSIRVDSIVYTVPETYAYILTLIDPRIERYACMDYIM
jgi:hypothetical protein